MRIRALLPTGHDGGPLEQDGIEFAVREGALPSRLSGYADPDDGLVLIDSYRVSESELRDVRDRGFRTAMFDDGKRLSSYAVDLLIDYTPGAEAFGYTGSPHTKFLLGPEYFPLREEFVGRPQETPGGDGFRLVVTFGGSDPDDLTHTVFSALEGARDIDQVYILGPGYRGLLMEQASAPRRKIVRNTPNMAGILSSADMVLSGGGGTALEAASLGRPLLIAVLSPDQRNLAASMEAAGAARIVGEQMRGTLVPESIQRHVEELRGDAQGRKKMSQCGRQIVDGKGAARISDAIEKVLS
jgi:spore coat polysaccharide biosynthesis predicted glycosyltransferase SpsG